MSKICFITTIPFSAKHFLALHMNELIKNNEIYLISNIENVEEEQEDFAGINLISVAISRKISLWSDIRGMVSLYCIMKRHRFDVVHSITPKAGLLGMLASYLARIPNRFHTFTGQVWVTRHGFLRWLLKSLDKMIVHCATGIMVDGFLQRQFLVKEGVVNELKARVLGHGSICGVDIHKFKPDVEMRAIIRKKYVIDDQAIVFLYIGRLNAEKGINELVEAFSQIAHEYDHARLFIVGPDEEQVQERIKSQYSQIMNQIVFGEYTKMPQQIMAASDVNCLPSHREGFNGVIIESACVGLPSFGSNIYGIADAIVDGETGILHEKGDVQGICNAMRQFLENPDEMRLMGRAARERAVKYFSQEAFVEEIRDYYKTALS